MEKEIKIEIPEGYEVDKEKSTFERIIFKVKEEPLPKTWEELETINGYYINKISDIIKVDKAPSVPCNKNIFYSKEEADAAIHLAQLSQLKAKYNTFDGKLWTPDFTNNELKYIIYFYRNNITVDTLFHTNEFLSFKTEERRDLFLKNFKELILKTKPLA